MAIIRPPGHHAMKAEYNGYCFFNNVAIAVQHALDKCGMKKILIVDWDVHHGQGTQRMFYNDPRVLFFSIHRYENGTFWPNLRESDFDYIGEGPGTGYNFNIPLNKTGMTNADYLAIFQQILMPIAIEVICKTYFDNKKSNSSSMSLIITYHSFNRNSLWCLQVMMQLSDVSRCVKYSYILLFYISVLSRSSDCFCWL